MTIINFYFTGTGGWIEYSQNGQIIKQIFDTSESLRNFINDNNIPLLYEHCPNCLP